MISSAPDLKHRLKKLNVLGKRQIIQPVPVVSDCLRPSVPIYSPVCLAAFVCGTFCIFSAYSNMSFPLPQLNWLSLDYNPLPLFPSECRYCVWNPAMWTARPPLGAIFSLFQYIVILTSALWARRAWWKKSDLPFDVITEGTANMFSETSWGN